MREVEVKFRVADGRAVIAVLGARGIEFGPAARQDDLAYAPAGWEFGDGRLGVAFLRLRTVDGRHFFALKQPGANAQACLEHETEIADRGQMHQAILRMGYRPAVRIAKTRRAASDSDVALCLDDLDGVGTFLELERMVPEHVPAEAVQDGLAAYVDALGIEGERVHETYDTLAHAAALAAGGRGMDASGAPWY
ncbi:class IV adenylate cyclase [Actinomadura fibrosa]|uniref:Class IV adenylate cyclase n=1 Tax=Actinomadura fibrosa TaxID=111802 RepID=A0ABW2XSP1_9ACTN|nr:CYTH domain-containing protein [Actinomadura fibrosa]